MFASSGVLAKAKDNRGKFAFEMGKSLCNLHIMGYGTFYHIWDLLKDFGVCAFTLGHSGLYLTL